MSLQSYLRRRYTESSEQKLRVVSVHTILQILTGVLSALVHLEQFGVLHRDIKADNVLVVGVEPQVTSKLIDFGLAKKFDSSRSNVAEYGCSATQDDSAEDAADGAAVEFDAKAARNTPSLLFAKALQYAPEALGKADNSGRNEHGLVFQFTHDSDLWAAGTMILWPLLYLACQQNLSNDFNADGLHNFGGRMFPFQLLGYVEVIREQWVPRKYERGIFSKRDSKSNMTVGNLIYEQLLLKFASQASTPDDKILFERMCHVCLFMCAFDPKDRKLDPHSPMSASQQCLNFLQHADASFSLPAADVGACTTGSVFDCVCAFIDNFCASGHYSGVARILSKTDRVRRVQFKSSLLSWSGEYSQSECKHWLFVNQSPTPVSDYRAMTFQNCLAPDYCVVPPQVALHASAQPRAIFLPRNKFCCGAVGLASMFEIECLSFVTQRDWFTVFRYERHGLPPWIVKLVNFALNLFTISLIPPL